MEIKNWLSTGCLLVLIPAWIGLLWAYFAGVQGKVKKLLFCWVTGFLTVMAVSQLILVPLVLRRFEFETYQNLAVIVYAVLILAAAALFAKGRKNRKTVRAEAQKKPWTGWQILFLVGALVLIFSQAATAGSFQHIDDDDSRFIVEQVIAVEKGSMYKEHLVTGDMTYWNIGEMRKDMLSPWAMLVAFWCKLSGIAPAVFAHKYLPFYLLLLCYAVYALIGMQLFRDDREKTSIFLLFAGALHLFGYFSTHTVQAVMLLRIWQGKALVGAMLIPAMYYLMYEIMEHAEEKVWYVLAAVCATAAALASGSGITLMPVLIGAVGGAQLIHTRKFKYAAAVWCTAIPSVIYLLCYMFFWQILKIYY